MGLAVVDSLERAGRVELRQSGTGRILLGAATMHSRLEHLRLSDSALLLLRRGHQG